MSLTFTSLDFLIFLGLSLGLIYSIRKQSVQKWLLIVLSYLFYLTSGIGGVLIITLTAAVDFNAARRLSVTSDERRRKLWLWTSLATNVGVLVFFKYAIFLIETVVSVLKPLGIHFAVPTLPFAVPVGLSYFTFAGISYVSDVYYERIDACKRASDYICYLVYFPKLLAGPIVRAGQLLPQLAHRVHISAQDFEIGCLYLLVGAVKKLVIADQLSSHVSVIFAAPQNYDAFTLLQGMLGYTAQIYADFSGYSDMAIGCARLMGIQFPQNFLMPYSSINIAEFWRRWHVTLSTWLRDYLFMPLELSSRGIKNPNVRVCRNVMITMLLCGLWHGASWNFVLWGGLHGAALAVYQVYTGGGRRRSRWSGWLPSGVGTVLSRLSTLSVVMVGWILFGTKTVGVAVTYVVRMLTWSNGVPLGSPYILPLTAAVLVAHLVINKDRNLVEEVATYAPPARILAYSTLLILLATLVPSDGAPFAYVQF